MRNKFIIAFYLVCFNYSSLADYVATGQFEGTVCHGIGITWCESHTIAAVKGDDGKPYSLRKTFNEVTEYNGETCIIKTKQSGGALINGVINAAKQPDFLEKTESGDYKKLDVEYITFPCVKR